MSLKIIRVELGMTLGGNDLVLKSRDLGKTASVRRWTPTAIECYKRGCMCGGCFYRDFFNKSNQRCHMKATVLELVRVIGVPDVELQQFINE